MTLANVLEVEIFIHYLCRMAPWLITNSLFIVGRVSVLAWEQLSPETNGIENQTQPPAKAIVK